MKIESRVIIQSNSSMGDLIETTHHSQIPHVQENTGISQRTPSFCEFERNNGKEIPACNERCRYSTVPHSMEISDIPELVLSNPGSLRDDQSSVRP